MERDIVEIARGLNLNPDQPIAEIRRKSWYDTFVAGDRRLKEVIIYLKTREAPERLPETETYYGVIPYLVEHPDALGIEVSEQVRRLLKLLERLHLVPKSTITQSEWNYLMQRVHENTAVDADGTIYGTLKFEQLDPNWLATIIIRELAQQHHKLGNTPEIVTTASDSLTLGLVGDWGTGYAPKYGARNPAQKVMAALAATHPTPTYMIHLGDVYYAGTEDSGTGPYDGEERSYFVDPWLGGQPLKTTSFMLNSNHEMYDLAQGYLSVGLADPRFSHQNQTSYFLIENDYWQIFGLDSAYASPDQTTFMTGGLTAEQISWMQHHRARAPNKCVMVMSHHNPITTDGRALVGADSSVPTLWSQALNGLNKKQPDLWYWGHVHNAVVYTGVGPNLPTPFTCRGRCIGNGAIPYGFAWGLAEPGSMSDYTTGEIPRKFTPIDSVAFFASTPVNDTDPFVKNGYAVVNLDKTNVTETIFDEDGVERWTNKWSIPGAP